MDPCGGLPGRSVCIASRLKSEALWAMVSFKSLLNTTLNIIARHFDCQLSATKSDERARLEKLIVDLIARSDLVDNENVVTHEFMPSGMECPLVGLEHATIAECGCAAVAEFGVEVSPQCRQVLEQHFQHKKLWSDVREDHNEKHMVKTKFLWSSSACQDFSNTGKGAGTHHPRGQFYELRCRYINHYRPDCFMLEQVPALKEMRSTAKHTIA